MAQEMKQMLLNVEEIKGTCSQAAGNGKVRVLYVKNNKGYTHIFRDQMKSGTSNYIYIQLGIHFN